MAPAKAAKKAAAKKAAAKKTAHKAAHKAAHKEAPAHAKKAAKKVAKKAAAKGADHTPARDLRRAYEHMGRLEALRLLLAEAVASEIEGLLRFAEGSLAAGDAKSGADLLRAGEHLAFGSLAAETGDGRPGDELPGEPLSTEALNECEDLLERAEEHWERHRSERAWPLDRTYKQARRQAEQSLRAGALRRALEYARAAEALGHVRGAPVALPAGRAKRRIEG